jgi:hypothetical protein
MEVPKIEQDVLPGFVQPDDPGIGKRYTHSGKQVLYCHEQYADAVTPTAAGSIAAAMNAADMQQDWARLISQVK